MSLLFTGAKGNIAMISKVTEHPIRRMIVDPDPVWASYDIGFGYGYFVHGHYYYPEGATIPALAEVTSPEAGFADHNFPRYLVEADGSNSCGGKDSFAGRYQHFETEGDVKGGNAIICLDPVTKSRTASSLDEMSVGFGCYINDTTKAVWSWDSPLPLFSADEGLCLREFIESAQRLGMSYQNVCVNTTSIARKGQ